MATPWRLFAAVGLVWATYLQIAVASAPPNLIDATLKDLDDGMSRGCFSSVNLVKAYLARIDEVNHIVKAVTEINPDALDIAQSLDDERARDIIRGPLHGVPILLKNSIGTADKMNTTAGSTLLIGARPKRDAQVVEHLRKAGAVILGKTNMSQWGGRRGFNVTSGWSAHGGQTLGAYHAEHNPGGSSSGSAVAADLGLAFAAVGTDTVGSISLPASRNGVVGIRPSTGRTSLDMVIAVSHDLDVVGPLARTVSDAAAVLDALSGTGDMAAACDGDGLANVTIGVLVMPQLYRHFIWRSLHGDKLDTMGDEMEAFEAALDHMRAAGARVVDVDMSHSMQDALDRYLELSDEILDADLAAALPAYLGKLAKNPRNVRSAADVLNLTRASPAEDYPLRATDILEGAARSSGPDSREVREARQRVQRWTERMLGDGLDALAAPATLEFLLGVGRPSVTVPLGHYSHDTTVSRSRDAVSLVQQGPGLPFGMVLAGAHGSDMALVAMACALERRAPVRARAKRVVQPSAQLARWAC